MRSSDHVGQYPLFSFPPTALRSSPIQHTPGHLNCMACHEARSVFTSKILRSMSFTEASALFLGSCTAPVTKGDLRYIKPRTFQDYQQNIKKLSVFFHSLPLKEIHVGHFAEYQRRRSTGEGFTRSFGKRVEISPAGPTKINQELAVLERIMRMAGAWTKDLECYYHRLQVTDSDIERALSEQEQEHFLTVASSKSEWHTVWWYSQVAVHLTFSTDEMRTIRIGDISLSNQIISVNRRFGKNRFRRRVIPICDGACMWAIQRLIERARDLCGAEPHHFLFPGRRVRNSFDPHRPMSSTGMRKQFEAVREAAGVPWFCLNGWRHTAITRLAEAGVPIATIMQRSGHVTAKMSDHYTHISAQAQRTAIMGVSQKKPVVSVGAAELHRQMTNQMSA